MKLVNISDYGIRGKLYYVQPNNLQKYNISSEDLMNIGVYNDDVFVAEEVALKLVEINTILQRERLEIVVKDGYRSSELYELVYKKGVRFLEKRTQIRFGIWIEKYMQHDMQ